MGTPLNLIDLLPQLSALRLFVNSVDVAPGDRVPAPVQVLHVRVGAIKFHLELERKRGWARPIVKVAWDFERKLQV